MIRNTLNKIEIGILMCAESHTRCHPHRDVALIIHTEQTVNEFWGHSGCCMLFSFMCDSFLRLFFIFKSSQSSDHLASLLLTPHHTLSHSSVRLIPI